MSWYLESGKDSDVVLSTRIRLKRNFNDIAFLPKISEDEKEEVFKRIKKTSAKTKESFQVIKLSDLDSITLRELIEKNLITPEFANFYPLKDFNKKIANNNFQNQTNNLKYIFISDDEDICIALNYEEHINMQIFSSGNDARALYNRISKIDEEICSMYDIAYDEQHGFLTSSIIDVGTAMKISAFIHMPAIVQVGGLNKVLDSIGKFGMTIKKVSGLLGDSVYQISTRQTLGVSEEDLINSFQAVISNIVNQERTMRKYCVENNIEFLDKIYRSLGVFKYAKKINQQEGEELISNIKIGVDLGLIDSISDSQIRQYMLYNKNANLQKALKNTYSEKELQIERAKFLQQL